MGWEPGYEGRGRGKMGGKAEIRGRKMGRYCTPRPTSGDPVDRLNPHRPRSAKDPMGGPG